MRVGDRRLGAELPHLAEVRSPKASEDAPEELRLGLSAARPTGEPAPLASPPRAATPAGYASLQASLARLGSEELDAEALAMLDSAGRAQLAPRLTAIREMAQTIERLLGMRREATARLRAQGSA